MLRPLLWPVEEWTKKADTTEIQRDWKSATWLKTWIVSSFRESNNVFPFLKKFVLYMIAAMIRAQKWIKSREPFQLLGLWKAVCDIKYGGRLTWVLHLSFVDTVQPIASVYCIDRTGNWNKPPSRALWQPNHDVSWSSHIIMPQRVVLCVISSN